MGFLNFGGQPSDDPTICGVKYKVLRDQIRKNSGKIKCGNCGDLINVDLRNIMKIAKEKKKNSNRIDPSYVSTQIFFGLANAEKKTVGNNIDRPMICKKCQSVFCIPCSKKERDRYGTVICPKCKGDIEFISSLYMGEDSHILE
jgi:predicted Zn finger-like uncharacterized protein